MPRTTGCQLKRPEYAEAEEIRLMDSKGNLSIEFWSTINEIFQKFDLIMCNTIDFKEFKGFLEIIGKKLNNEKEFKDTILSKYNSYKDSLTSKGFAEWWK